MMMLKCSLIIVILEIVHIVEGNCNFKKYYGNKLLAKPSSALGVVSVGGAPKCLYLCETNPECATVNVLYSHMKGFTCSLIGYEKGLGPEQAVSDVNSMWASRQVNLLETKDVTCNASSHFPGFVCEHVYNGNLNADMAGSWASNWQDSGSWLQLNLPRTAYIFYITLWKRCTLPDQYNSINITFSDNSHQTMFAQCLPGTGHWTNCDGIPSDEMDLDDVISTGIMLTFLSSCAPGGNPGLREVDLGGYYI